MEPIPQTKVRDNVMYIRRLRATCHKQIIGQGPYDMYKNVHMYDISQGMRTSN